jgi:hypothetical protein
VCAVRTCTVLLPSPDFHTTARKTLPTAGIFRKHAVPLELTADKMKLTKIGLTNAGSTDWPFHHACLLCENELLSSSNEFCEWSRMFTDSIRSMHSLSLID